MTRYRNGQVPTSILIKRDVIRLSAGTWAKWDRLVAIVKERHGVTLVITRGSGVTLGSGGYRDYAMQVAVKKKYTDLGKPGQAATPGTSSHGGTYRNEDALAVDVNNWGRIGQTPFFKAAREAGFAAGVISKEPWHIIDGDPWRTVAPPKEGDTVAQHYFRDDGKALRKGGLDLAPAAGTWLNTSASAASSQATNIVGGVGEYSFTLHVYAQGKPGDIVDLVLAWDNTKTSGPHSMHFVERIEIGADGTARRNVPFARAVAAGFAVYARLATVEANEEPVTITRFASDALLFQ